MNRGRYWFEREILDNIDCRKANGTSLIYSFGAINNGFKTF